jgi:hypothetical protein
MFKLIRLDLNEYMLIDDAGSKPVFGNLRYIASMMHAGGIDWVDIEDAVVDLQCHDNDTAHFGVMGRYMYSTKKIA